MIGVAALFLMLLNGRVIRLRGFSVLAGAWLDIIQDLLWPDCCYSRPIRCHF